MALTFATNSMHLVNWGFSLGDVATLAGAGRHVITWLTADPRDSALLDFLKVSPTDLGFRRGLLDPVTLNRRWSQRLALLRDGQRIEVRPEGSDSELENLGRFTWVMTLIVVGLDEVTTSHTLRKIIVALTEALFTSSTLKIDYLSQEIPEHIKGWRSIGVTRMIAPRARDIWEKLERQKVHLPGYAPDSEFQEILRFLQWLVVEDSPKFATASTDVYALAMLLSEIGFDCLKLSAGDSEHLESYATVVLDVSMLMATPPRVAEKRVGMRIPLNNPDEVVSLWPGTATDNNRRRGIFKTGQRTAATLSLAAVSSPFGNGDLDPGILVLSKDPTPHGRSDPDICRLADKFLLFVNLKAIQGLEEVVDSWRIQSSSIRELVLASLADSPMGVMSAPEYQEYKADLQIFLLGYYYEIYSHILDTSRLGVKEGFGTWGWYDSNVFDQIGGLIKSQIKRDEKGKKREGMLYWRYQILKMAAFLLAGADSRQLAAITHGTIGLHAKLTITTSALFGGADTPAKITKLCLLDIDPTAIPSSGLGIIKPAIQSRPVCVEPKSKAMDLSAKFVDGQPDEDDFTSHIEPAWGYDPNLCFVTYRHKGRLVHRISPSEMEAAVLCWWTGSTDSKIGMTTDVSTMFEALSQHALSKSPTVSIYPGSCSEFYTVQGGSIVVPKIKDENESDSPVWVYMLRTGGRSKVRCSIVTMYSHIFADKAWGWLDFDWSSVCSGALVAGIDAGPNMFGTGTIIVL